jgi:hypothetical protein
VSVIGFSPEMHPPQDMLMVNALNTLSERLRGFGSGVAGEVVYEPALYRGVLQRIDQANGAVADWPWTDIQPADFTSGVNDFLLVHPLTAAQVAVLAIPGVQGGMSGLNLTQGSGLYSLSLRPLLPDEKG